MIFTLVIDRRIKIFLKRNFLNTPYLRQQGRIVRHNYIRSITFKKKVRNRYYKQRKILDVRKT